MFVRVVTSVNIKIRKIEFTGRTKLGILLLKKMNAVRSVLDDIKTKQLE